MDRSSRWNRSLSATAEVDSAWAAFIAKKRAEEVLNNRKADLNYAAAEAELAQAVAQLKTLSRKKKNPAHH